MYGYESSCPEGVDQNTALLATAAAIGNTGKYFIYKNIYLDIPPTCSCGCGGDLPRGDAAAGWAEEAECGQGRGRGGGDQEQAAGPRHARWVWPRVMCHVSRAVSLCCVSRAGEGGGNHQRTNRGWGTV